MTPSQGAQARRPDPRLPTQTPDMAQSQSGGFGTLPPIPLRPSAAVPFATMALWLYRDLPRAVDIINRRAQHLGPAEQAVLRDYSALLHAPHLIAILQIAVQQELSHIKVISPLPQNPVLRSAALLRGLIEAVGERGISHISTAHMSARSESAELIQARIQAELASILANSKAAPAAQLNG